MPQTIYLAETTTILPLKTRLPNLSLRTVQIATQMRPSPRLLLKQDEHTQYKPYTLVD